MVSYKALMVIEAALSSMIKSGKDITKIILKVSPDAEIADQSAIETRFGLLLIEPGEYIPKGYAYLIERPLSRGGLGIKSVGKKQSSPASVGERGQ